MKDLYLSLPSGGGKITDIHSSDIKIFNDGYLGFSAYIKFNNGILICYGRFSKLKNGSFITFLEPFTSSYYAVTISRTNDTSNATASNSAIWTYSRGSTGFNVKGDETADSSYGIWGDYIAIGTWK